MKKITLKIWKKNVRGKRKRARFLSYWAYQVSFLFLGVFSIDCKLPFIARLSDDENSGAGSFYISSVFGPRTHGVTSRDHAFVEMTSQQSNQPLQAVLAHNVNHRLGFNSCRRQLFCKILGFLEQDSVVYFSLSWGFDNFSVRVRFGERVRYVISHSFPGEIHGFGQS